MNINTLISKRWVVGIFAFLLLLFAFFPVQADTPVTEPDTDEAEAAENAIYLPIVPFGPKSSVEPTATPSATPTKSPTLPPPEYPAGDTTYYISPAGDDSRSGLSEAEAWATFDRAWQALYPGDTLILLDGVYLQSIIPNQRNGEPGRPITIRAKNDGEAIIDGQHQRVPVHLESKKYYVIEGIVAINSTYHVFWIRGGDHNSLRRVSGYNADTDDNAHVFVIVSSEHNLIEDCAASGTGRKMVLIFMAENNIIRRCYTDWREWDGREWGSCWPWGEGVEIYGGSFNVIENSIAYGHTSRAGISLMAQYPQTAIGNKILGTMAVLSGMQEDVTPMVWGDTRPRPTDFTCVQKFDQWPSLRSGFRVGDNGDIRDNLLQDIFAWGSAGLGLTFHQAGTYLPIVNNHVVRATIINNGLDNPNIFGGIQTDAIHSELVSRFDSVENSKIENIFINHLSDGSRNMTSMTGEGARLTNRYIDGLLTSEPLWPWPMEDRIQAELGFSVTKMMTNLIFGTSDLSEIYP